MLRRYDYKALNDKESSMTTRMWHCMPVKAVNLKKILKQGVNRKIPIEC